MLLQVKTIPLSKGQSTLVDDIDFEKFAQFVWTAQKRTHGFHAARYCGKKYVYLHREILGAPAGIEVDHRDGDGLNNRRGNLRLATKSQNGAAFRTLRSSKSSKFRGVVWHKGGQKWMARIVKDMQSIYLGLFVSEEDAAHAYDTAAKHYFCEFARPNFA